MLRKHLFFLFRPHIKHSDIICEWKLNAFYQMLFTLLFTVCIPLFLIFVAIRIPVMALVTTLIAFSIFVPLPFIRKGKLTLAVHIFEFISFYIHLYFLYMLRLNDSVYFLFFDSLIAGIFLSFRAAIGWTAIFTAGLAICSITLPELSLLPELYITGTTFKIISHGTHLSTAIFITWAGAFISILFNRYVIDLISSVKKKNEILSVEIAERAAAEKKALAAREFSDQIIAEAGEGILVFDSMLKCVVWNPAMEHITGLSFAEIKGIYAEELFNQIGLSSVLPKVKQAQEGQAVKTELYEFLVNSSHRAGWVMIQLNPHHLSSEEPNGVVAMIHDVSEQHRLEETLRQSQKMEAVGQLAGGIAHDFNNQLTCILGYAQLLRRDLAGHEKHVQWASNVIQGANRASDLTHKLLAFARKSKIRSMPVDIHQIINELVTILEHSIDKKIRITKELKAFSPWISGDPTLLQNALLNLSLNARDAMPDGGELCFTTEVQMDVHHLSHENKPVPCLAIMVRDTGTGIPPEISSRIFDPFFTTKEPGKGTGMGLAAVYGTIKEHQGTITFDSKVGTGTEFTIFLPLSTSVTNVANDLNTPSENKPKANTGNILFIDDESTILDIAEEVLTNLGYNVVCAHDGKEGIDIFSKGAFDCAVVDYIMPRMNGAEAVRELLRIDPGLKIIFLSGYGLKENMFSENEVSTISFMPKPFKLEDLAATIQRVIEKDRKS